MVDLIPRYAEVSNQVCILYGCSVPVILRQHRCVNEYYWQLIGEAYVHEYMDEEGISTLSPADLKSREIEFEIR